MYTRTWLFILCWVVGFAMQAQRIDLPPGHDAQFLMDRLDIQLSSSTLNHTYYRPFSRTQLTQALLSRLGTKKLSSKEKEWYGRMLWLVSDSVASTKNDDPLLGFLYGNRRDLWQSWSPDLKLVVNPILHAGAGREMYDAVTATDSSFSRLLYTNTRGVQVRGELWNRVGFYTELADNQLRLPSPETQYYAQRNALPGQTFVKRIGGTTNGFDYFTARGYITYIPVNQLRIKFGKDRTFWGYGKQSLHLSDFSTDHLMLDIRTRFWKVEYVNHFALLTDYFPNKPDQFGIQPRKYGAFHALSYAPVKNLSITAFEGVIYSPVLPGGRRGFEPEYLNPIIFYRAVEQSIGSPDNATLGLAAKYNFLNRFRLYGQLMLDDFNFRNRKVGTGYWGNKYGYQLGFNYVNMGGITGLDGMLEYNRIRPYTYGHVNPAANYTHYGQPLAHSAGANLHEILGELRFQVTATLSIMAGGWHRIQGLNDSTGNLGGDIFISNSLRVREFGNSVAQGFQLTTTQIYGRIRMQLWHLDAWAEIEGAYRKSNIYNTFWINGSLRFNIGGRTPLL